MKRPVARGLMGLTGIASALAFAAARIALLLTVTTAGMSGCSCGILGFDFSDCDASVNQSGPEIPPAAPTPRPVISINNAGVGLAAYAENRDVVARRFDELTGFGTPQTVASGVEDDLDLAVAGNAARIVWGGRTTAGAPGGISAISGDLQTGTWNMPVDLASGADDPIFARGRHDAAARSVVVWRAGRMDFDGFDIVEGLASSTLQAPYALVTNYAFESGVSDTGLFNLRAATSGLSTIAVWTARQRSDSSITHAWVSGTSTPDNRWPTAFQLARVNAAVTPAIDMDDDGNVIIVWAGHEGEGLYFSRTPLSNPPRILHRPEQPLHEVQVDASWNGNTAAAWELEAGGGVWSGLGNVSTDEWSDIQRLDVNGATVLNGRDPRVAVDQVGRAVVVWRNDTSVYANLYNGDSWSAPELLGPTHSAPDIDMNDRGLAIAVWWNEGLQHRLWTPPNSLTASFTYRPDPGIAGRSLLFDARSSSGPAPVVRAEWVWGDGQSGGGGTHAYAMPGTYTAQLTVTDSVGQVATTTRDVNIVAVGSVSSEVTVNYSGTGVAQLEIHSSEPGFVPITCTTTTTPGQPGSGTCAATLLGGYDVTIVADYDFTATTFSGWPRVPFQECDDVTTSSASGRTRSVCEFGASVLNRRFNITFQDTGRPPGSPNTEELQVRVVGSSTGGGTFNSIPTQVICSAAGSLVTISSGPDVGESCNYRVATGTTLLVVATPNAGNRFVQWLGCDRTPPATSIHECEVTMNDTRRIEAQFQD
jgi:hypothetical protein